MANVASWVREKDEPLFQRFFDKYGVKLFNARRGAVDWTEMDGLLITGGEDISAPYLRQEIPDPSLIEDPVPERDLWEFQTLPLALAEGKPVFAICKGHQVLNVGLGGTLYLDIEGHDLPETKTANIQPLRFGAKVPAHQQIEKVNSSHHQAIDRLGEGLEIEAWSATDDVVEQVRMKNYPFALGVQYHPERDWIYESLFKDFFEHLIKT